MFPGPLIQANKVTSMEIFHVDLLRALQGDRFIINVNNELTDSSMPLETSVVSSTRLFFVALSSRFS